MLPVIKRDRGLAGILEERNVRERIAVSIPDIAATGARRQIDPAVIQHQVAAQPIVEQLKGFDRVNAPETVTGGTGQPRLGVADLGAHRPQEPQLVPRVPSGASRIVGCPGPAQRKQAGGANFQIVERLRPRMDRQQRQ